MKSYLDAELSRYRDIWIQSYMDTEHLYFKISGYLDSCIPEYLSTWPDTIHGYHGILLYIWKPGYMDTWIPGYLYTWIPVYLDIWIPGYRDTRITGYLDTGIPGFLDTCIPGYQNTKISEYLDSWIPGYQNT